MGKDLILVVDDELDNRVMMRYFLESWGYDVELAADGKEALGKVVAKLPSLVLLDLEMPVMNGFETCQRLKGAPETEHIPVIMFTGLEQTADKVKGIRGGADDYVVKTVDPEELQARIEMILRRTRRYEAPAPGGAPQDAGDQAVSGSLSELYFPEAMQLILAYGKSGLLHLRDGDREGRVYLRDGQVVHAAYGDLEGESAFYELALWKSGHFGFQVGETAERETIQRSGTNLLIEATRRLDEWNLISSKIPNFDVVPRRTPFDEENSIRLTRVDWSVLRHIDGKRSIREIVESQELDLFETGRIIFGLLTVGIVSIGDPQPRSSPLYSMVPELASELKEDGPFEVSAAQWRMIVGIDGKRSIGALADQLGISAQKAVDTLKVLAAMGLVRIPKSPSQTGDRTPARSVRGANNEKVAETSAQGFRPRIRAMGFD